MFDFTLRVVSYQSCMKSEATKLVGNMSESQKQHLLDSIKTQHGIQVLMGQQINVNMLQHVEKLLQTNDETR